MSRAVALLRAQAYNNAWANDRLLRACAALDDAALHAARDGFFPSIAATLNHILIVDHFYIDALEGGTLGVAAFADRMPCPAFAQLDRAQREADARLIAHTDGLVERDLDSIVAVHRRDYIQHERRDRLLLHLFQHQIHHRGQAHAMLSGAGIRPPQLDEFFSADDQRFRAAEISALGFDEAHIWRT